MNVLVLAPFYPSPYLPSVGVFIHEQVKSLIDTGCSVRVICPVGITPPFSRKLKWKSIKKTPVKMVYEGVEIYFKRTFVLPRNLTKRFQPAIDFAATFRLVKTLLKEGKVDVIHAHTAYHAGGIARRIKKRLSVPFVVTVHGADFQELIHRRYYKKQIISVLKKADAVVCVSNKLFQIAIKEGLSDSFEKFSVVHNGIRMDSIGKSDAAYEKRIFTILCVGSFYEAKGQEYLIDAVNRVMTARPELRNKLRCVFVGDGLRKALMQKKAEALALGDLFEFTGALSHKDTMNRYAGADLFVLPSYRESFGMVYLEAMANGLPVIGVDGQGICEIITDKSEGFLIPPGDSYILALRIEQMIENPELLARMGDAAKRRVTQCFDLTQKSSQLLELYKKLTINMTGVSV